MKKLFYILILIQALPISGQIKKTGTPNIVNYPKSVYNAGTQNWGICQDDNNFMYFANNEGVLIFNGTIWEKVDISQFKPVRSIFKDSKNNIYIGLLNDFGKLEINEKGLYDYKSLRSLLPEDTKDFDEIWKIFEIPGERIIFQTFEYLFILENDKIEIIKPKNEFHFSFNIDGKIFIQEPGTGVFEYSNGLINILPWSDEFKNKEIISILKVREDFLLICTSGSGIYKYINGNLDKWDTPAGQFIEKEKLFSAINVIGNNLAFGTILNGLIISDSYGNIIQHINNDIGLQNNTILSLFSDSRGNLWLGLDNGIDYIEINSPISYITNNEGIGTGYCSAVFDGNLYLGTNQGLYVKSFDKFSEVNGDFELVKNTAGQVWTLNIFNGQLLCGHNSGTFIIKDKIASKISNLEGAWTFSSVNENPDLLLGGFYKGLFLLRNGSKGWEFFRKIDGFNESCRFLEQDNNNIIWVSHGALGVFKIELNADLDSAFEFKLYNSENGLPSDQNNIVFKLDNKVFVSAINGFYIYNDKTDQFILSEKFNGIFGLNSRLKTFEKDSNGNIWYIAQDESGVLRLNEDSTFTKILSPFKQLNDKYVNEFESIYPYDDSNIFIGIDNGFAHYSSNLPKSYSSTFNSFITRIELPYLDSVIYYNHFDSQNIHFEFPFPKNSFRFYFTSPFFEAPYQLEFSFYLENYSENWSGWSKNNFRDFTNLQEGIYSFKIKSKNIYGAESDISSFDFEINPPWHRSKIAYYSYVAALLIMFFLSYRYIKYRMKLSRNREQEKHKIELKKKEEQFQNRVLLSEREIIKLRNDKLRAEMVHRDKELANQTMNIIQKNKFLIKLNQELNLIKNTTDNPQLKTRLVVISRRLDKEIDNKKQDKVFKTYFEEVHEEFFKRIKEKHPKLSPRELHLSAYIRMNLSTKEIATLINISTRGVEISRYRLRKKIGISRNTNLSTYLSNI